MSLTCKTLEQHQAAGAFLSKQRPGNRGEERIDEIWSLFALLPDDTTPNMVKRNGEWIVRMHSAWWEESNKGMIPYEGVDPTQLSAVKKYRLVLLSHPTYIATLYENWIQNRKEAQVPSWLNVKDDCPLQQKQAAIKLVNALSTHDIGLHRAELHIKDLLPIQDGIERPKGRQREWFNQQTLTINSNLKEEITAIWWEQQEMQVVTLGRKYVNNKTKIGPTNTIPEGSQPIFAIKRNQIPPPREEVVWAGSGFHQCIPKTKWLNLDMDEEQCLQLRPSVYNGTEVRTVVEMDGRGLTLPTPLNNTRLKATRYSIPLSQLKQITIYPVGDHHEVIIKTEARQMKTTFRYHTDSPDKWRTISLLVKHIEILDRVQGSRTESQWRIKKAADALRERARGLFSFPRIQVHAERPPPSPLRPMRSSSESPQRKRPKTEIPNTPKRTPKRKLKYNEDPTYQPGGVPDAQRAPEYIVTTWNARSLMCTIGERKPKLEALFQLLQRDLPDILLLQETWMIPSCWRAIAGTIENLGWWVTVSQEGGPGRGMAILTKKSRGPRPIIVRQARGKTLQAVWNNITISNIHAQKKESLQLLQLPGTMGHIMAGDWNKPLHHPDTTCITTCWPCAAANHNKIRPYDHILADGMQTEDFTAIRRGAEGKGYGGSDHAAVVKGVTTKPQLEGKSFPMWRPQEGNQHLKELEQWVQGTTHLQMTLFRRS